MTPPVSPSPPLPLSPKNVKKHVTNDELVKGGNHSYSLPLIRGGLGWGLLFMQKRDAPVAISCYTFNWDI